MEKVILITGCSSGIGYELIQPLLEKGHIVYATLRNAPERSHSFQELLQNYPRRLSVLQLDVTKEQERLDVVQRVVSEQQRLDVLINNAGFGIFGPFEEVPPAEFREQLEVNFFAASLLTQVALPMLRKSQGRIIVLSSILGEVGFPFTSLYSSSKFALEGLFEALSHEVADFGVQVGIVLPGGHKTSFDKNRRRFTKPDSPYAVAEQRFFRVMKESPKDHRAPASHVVKVILRLIEQTHLPLRTYVGTDAKMIHYLHSLLPQFIFQPLLRFGVRIRSRG